MPDVVIIGSGPNGLAAAIELARHGVGVRVVEAAETPGGGMRSAELTEPGFVHDVCSAVHPMGILSPAFRSMPLADYGLEWASSEVSVAHPMENGDAALLFRDLDRTAARLGRDGAAWRRMIRPFLRDPHRLMQNLLAPLRVPSMPFSLGWFGAQGILPASTYASLRFDGELAKALFAGCAAHSILPFNKAFTAAVGLIFAITGHIEPWPVVRGGSQALADALLAHLRALGGTVETGHRVENLDAFSDADAILFDVSPTVMTRIAGDHLPARYRRRLERFRYGPGTFKIDYALSESIPWKNPRVREASTVHLGGTIGEIAHAEAEVWKGRHAQRPFVLLCQQSELDASRAPKGQHTGYAYCHVPAGSKVDMTYQLEAQIERFAPGFRDTVIARHVRGPAAWEAYNPNYVGGAIAGGASDWRQLFTRPVARLDPYRTPNARLYICSASSPPGGGVHGMCGYWAARSALRRMRVPRRALPAPTAQPPATVREARPTLTVVETID